MKHTELPWKIDREFLVGQGAEFPDEGAMEPKIAVFMTDEDAPSEYMGKGMREANKEYVLRACNYHQKLYNALQNLVYNPTEFNVDHAADLIMELDAQEVR
jgi:hypothetical protein